jgi:integrase
MSAFMLSQSRLAAMIPQDNNNLSKDATEQKIHARPSQGPPRSRTDLRFWKRKIFKPEYRRSDNTKARSANYAVEISFRGRRLKWSMDTPNQDAAAARAKEIYLFIQANGWEAAVAHYRPKEAPPSKPVVITIGEFLDQVRASSLLKSSTFNDYAEALRRISGDIAAIHSRQGRLQKTGSLSLATITTQKLEQWKRDFLAHSKRDPISQRAARVSVNSYLRRAKCLFSKRILKHLAIQLPTPLPFAELEFERRPSLKYRSSFDIRRLFAQAREELFETGQIELFKIFILAATCGLRRREIDLLPWTAFRWEEGILRIEPTEFFRPKSEESIADIPLDPEVVDLFRGYYVRARSEFVIESNLAPNPHASYIHYRCHVLFEKLSKWLREHGVKMMRPLHGLRKEFGSVINRSHGIHAASRALRHASIGITSDIYVDSRVRTTSGLGVLLASGRPDNVLPIRDETKSAAATRPSS